MWVEKKETMGFLKKGKEVTGRCSGKNINFRPEKLLIKYNEKFTKKNNKICFIGSKFHIHLNDCGGAHASPCRPWRHSCAQEL